VRPENVVIQSQPDGASLPAEVYVAEALGNETLVRLQVAGQELVARADATYEPEVGSRVWVRPNLDRAHLFDARDQHSIV
jgi:sn-glycerol 3-phosphate transport system ATP-binding protein